MPNHIHYQPAARNNYARPEDRIIIDDPQTLARVAAAKKRILAREAAERAERAAQSAAAKEAKK